MIHSIQEVQIRHEGKQEKEKFYYLLKELVDPLSLRKEINRFRKRLGYVRTNSLGRKSHTISIRLDYKRIEAMKDEEWLKPFDFIKEDLNSLRTWLENNQLIEGLKPSSPAKLLSQILSFTAAAKRYLQPDPNLPFNVDSLTFPFNRPHAVFIQKPWGEKLMDLEKAVETRSYRLPPSLLGRELLLIESLAPAKETIERNDEAFVIVGIITFDECFLYSSKEEWEGDFHRHLVPPESKFYWNESKPKYGWKVSSAQPFPRPIRPPCNFFQLFRSIYYTDQGETELLMQMKEQKEAAQSSLEAKNMTDEEAGAYQLLLAFFRSISLHPILAKQAFSQGLRTLEDLAKTDKGYWERMVRVSLPSMSQLFWERSRLHFTTPERKQARTTNRRDFMSSLTETVGALPIRTVWEQKLDQEIDLLFEENGGKVVSGDLVMESLEKFREIAERYAYPDTTPRENLVLKLFSYCPQPLANSIREKRNTFAHLLHYGVDLLISKLKLQTYCPDLYLPLCERPVDSLAEQDPGFKDLLIPDETGFRGHTAYGPLFLIDRGVGFFDEQGYCYKGETFNTPIVRIKSEPPAENGFHSPLFLGYSGGSDRYMFPPLTLFKVRQVRNSFRMREYDHKIFFREMGKDQHHAPKRDYVVKFTQALSPPPLSRTLDHEERGEVLDLRGRPGKVLLSLPTWIDMILLISSQQLYEISAEEFMEKVEMKGRAIMVAVPQVPPEGYLETFLVDGDCQKANRKWLGSYTTVLGMEVNGRPVFQKGSSKCHLIYGNGCWWLLDKQYLFKENLRRNAYFYLESKSSHPPLGEGKWNERLLKEDSWKPADLKVSPAAPVHPAIHKASSSIPFVFAWEKDLPAPGATNHPFVEWPTIEVNQPLVTCFATFLAGRDKAEGEEEVIGKTTTTQEYLEYGQRKNWARGMEDIVNNPSITMEQEFLRNDEWVSFDRVSYFGKQEWDYVVHEVARKREKRDKGNEGKTLDTFLKDANDTLWNRFQGKRKENPGMIDQFVPLLKEEVIAVRLYSGPAFQPINTFLREVAKLSREWRIKLAKDPTRTYAATIRWLLSAIRKMSIGTPVSRLFRGVKGELPPTFDQRDSKGIISAVDYGFMSTSTTKKVPLSSQNENKKQTKKKKTKHTNIITHR